MKASVVGGGIMGAGIAGVLAARGYRVSVYSRTEATLNAARSVVETIAGAVAGVDFSMSVDACVEGADVVSENVAEDLTLKQEIFRTIERVAPSNALLTTNTSSVPIGSIAAALREPGRLVGMHWFNPPALMPLIEIVRGPSTTDEAVARARQLCETIGKEMIEVARDIPGFVVNRLQYAMLREVCHLVESGIVSIADIDRAVETTLAPRWSSSGPLRLMDLGGLDTVEKVSAIIMPALSRSEKVSPLVADRVRAGSLGTKSGRGFYDWTPETIADAKRERDATVQLVNGRRGS
ncbi:3-hydroxyacyl-CoA dehydrogenase family protein [uncultured Enterovirga sp.]|uniref:3-hydroxyacyl-CoA dehydrogenase family protein n=1 Tax=uncultured Enterovirga sp. TaxID=2026352 RepID=UPI0035CAEA6F